MTSAPARPPCRAEARGCMACSCPAASIPLADRKRNRSHVALRPRRHGVKSGASQGAASMTDLAQRPQAAAAELPALGTLAVYNLGKRYGGRAVVQDVSLVVRQGEAVGLLGPNGAGKTTVSYMITGLVKPDKGVIALDGHDVTALPMYQRARLGVGYLPQHQCRGQHPRRARSQRARPRAAGAAAGATAGGIRHRPLTQSAVDLALRRRAAALRDRAGAGRTACLHPARRTVR